MAVNVDPVIRSKVEGGDAARVIVTFDHRPTSEDLAAYDVVFELGSIDAAVMRIDRASLDRLVDERCVIAIEADGEIRAQGS